MTDRVPPFPGGRRSPVRDEEREGGGEETRIRGLPTEVRRVVIRGALESDGSEEWDDVPRGALVSAETLRYHVDVVEHLEDARRGLVDGADDGPAVARQPLQHGHQLRRRGTVQAPAQTNRDCGGIGRGGPGGCAVLTWWVRRGT